VPAIPHVVRRGAFYYWRRRLPAALAESRKSATLMLGLRTSDPTRARFLAGQISALADRCFFPVAMNHQLSHQQLQQIFRDVFTRHLDKLDRVAARERLEPDFDADKSRRGDRIMGWVYRLLETRGRSAGVDERAEAQMAVEGMSATDTAEVSAMLELMRRQNGVCDPPERLSSVVTGVGAEPNPMNLALAQEAIYRAMSSANFQSERRYDGVRIELEKLVADALERRIGEGAPAKVERAPLVAERRSESQLVVEAQPQETGESMSAPRSQNDCARATRQEQAWPGAPAALQRSATPMPATVSQHPFVIFAEGLIKKNAEAGVWDIKTQRQVRQISELFGKLLMGQGIVDVVHIRQEHFAHLDDLFGALAKSYGKSPKDSGRSIDELRAIGANKSPTERGLEAGTVNRHITFLGQILTHIRSRGHKLHRDIDLSLLRRKEVERARNKRSSLSEKDIASIFNLACFTGCAGWKGADAFMSGPNIFHRALYFAPMLLHYTGARREEICGLEVDDVHWIDAELNGEATRIHYISIRPNNVRRVKNVQSVRSVVLHPELIRLGFIEYVEATRALGYRLLFPDLRSPTSSSPLGDRLYDEFIDGLRKAVPDAVERKKVVHSLRKSFGNLLKQKGVHSEIRGDIMGHAGRNTTEEIYCDPIALAEMFKEVMKIPALTKHLERRPLRLLPWVQDKLPPPFSRGSRKTKREG
jgi:integrase